MQKNCFVILKKIASVVTTKTFYALSTTNTRCIIRRTLLALAKKSSKQLAYKRYLLNVFRFHIV